jgi:hypothetical protein
MEEAALKSALHEIEKALATVSFKPIDGRGPAEGVYIPADPAKAAVEDSLDMLRVQVKYLIFDLEATRRENRYLLHMLESRPQKDIDESSDDRPF